MPFKNPLLVCCLHAKSKQDADSKAEFPQKHCDTALVNKLWAEQDQLFTIQ